MIAKFSKVTFDEWLTVYNGDAALRAKFMKDDIVGKVDDHTAMIKATKASRVNFESTGFSLA